MHNHQGQSREKLAPRSDSFPANVGPTHDEKTKAPFLDLSELDGDHNKDQVSNKYIPLHSKRTLLSESSGGGNPLCAAQNAWHDLRLGQCF